MFTQRDMITNIISVSNPDFPGSEKPIFWQFLRNRKPGFHDNKHRFSKLAKKGHFF